MRQIFNFKTILVLFLGLFFTLPFQSCKKGEDDPALSFRSRKARVVGEWTLKEFTVNGKAEPMDGVTKLEFKKDGTGKIINIDNNMTNTYASRWDFLGGNGDYKKKERLFLYDEKSPDGQVYEIVELRNKKMTWRLLDESGNSKDDVIIKLEQ
jgi:hypothetical protein